MRSLCRNEGAALVMSRPAAAILVRQFLRFGLVGCVGFCVDTAVLYAAMDFLGAGPYYGRLLSYLVAATSTWYLNRIVTFRDRHSANKAKQWLRFLFFNCAGGGVNYLTYVSYLHFLHPAVAGPLVGVALGSCAGLIINFSLSRYLVFAPAQTVVPPSLPSDVPAPVRTRSG
ncbi:MAG TPA: GtrA family protein [Steroidobacteraceae bacterium]